MNNLITAKNDFILKYFSGGIRPIDEGIEYIPDEYKKAILRSLPEDKNSSIAIVFGIDIVLYLKEKGYTNITFFSNNMFELNIAKHKDFCENVNTKLIGISDIINTIINENIKYETLVLKPHNIKTGEFQSKKYEELISKNLTNNIISLEALYRYGKIPFENSIQKVNVFKINEIIFITCVRKFCRNCITDWYTPEVLFMNQTKDNRDHLFIIKEDIIDENGIKLKDKQSKPKSENKLPYDWYKPYNDSEYFMIGMGTDSAEETCKIVCESFNDNFTIIESGTSIITNKNFSMITDSKSKPLNITIKDVKLNCLSWQDILRTFMEYISTNYRSNLDNAISNKTFNSNSKLFKIYEGSTGLRKPLEIDQNVFIETNLSADGIIRKIFGIYKSFGLDINDITFLIK